MHRSLAASLAATLLFAAALPAAANPGRGVQPPGPPQLRGTEAPVDHVGTGALDLRVLGTYETGVFDASAAEIVAHHPATQRLYVVNAEAGLVEVLDVSDPTDLRKVAELPSAVPGGVANSVAVRDDGLVAVAVEDPVKTDPGTAQLWRFDAAPELLGVVEVGALPDMLTFTPDGTTLLVANEGEPDDGFTLDPEGSVSVIDVSGDPAAITDAAVRTADLRAFEGDALPDGVRVFGPDVAAPAWQGEGDDAPGRVARNLEPEYVVTTDGVTAYVSLQEANAIGVLDVPTATFTDLLPLGRKDHLAPGNGIDPSDRDGEIRIADWPVLGMYQPDGFDAYEVGGSTYLVTANEGDGRDDWGAYEETTRASNLTLCEDAFAGFVAGSDRVGSVAELTAARNLGRLNVSTAEGQRADEGCYEELHVLGARSFSIWTADGELVFDSGDDFERITAAAVPEFFNSNHRENSFETRSDDKGPEPEDVAIAWLDGRAYAFVVLERIGGVMVYDITDPTAPQFVRYVNNRDFTAVPGTSQAGDLGAENVIVIAAEDSPIGQPLLAVANEVSGTTTLFRIGIADRTPPFGGGVADACRDARGPQARSCASPPARGRG